MNPHPVGIDLGTTHSAIARLDQTGRTVMVPNVDGLFLTPSVVLFDDAGIVVGREALKAIPVAAGRIARWVKRDMGSPSYSQPIGGHFLPPEAIQACILGQLRTDIERQLGTAYAPVITVPAFFDEPRRRATAEAAAMAGIPLLDIVNEPTAAALAFGEQLGYLDATGDAAEPLKLLVYDLGGGTFDVTIVDLRPGQIRALATDGDSMLGGYDWDRRLADFAAEEFLRTYGTDPRQDPLGLHQLLLSAEQAKLALSARQHATIRVTHNGKTREVPMTRESFEERTSDLLYRTSMTSRQVLASAGLRWSDLDRVLLVGGSTRMPMVRRMLLDLTGREPHGEVNPDEAVARGAAIYAGHLLRKRQPAAPAAAVSGAAPQPRQLEVTNVSAHSLGIDGYNVSLARRCNTVLIPRNSPLPARISRKFVTRKIGQHSIVVQVLEGESSRPEDCTRVGRLVIRNLPPGLPAGTPVKVTYEYGANGRLNVTAQLSGSN
ncbi:MAG TPA: Hsp70 family protein, partial [Pirellulaceae bacterium]|nr:Hsp70 family protein [Pirellulaceae bacterium]